MAKVQKPVKTYILSGLMMIVYTLVFSVMSLVFMIDKIPNVVKIIFGVVFEIPIIVIFFSVGMKEGAAYYKKASKDSLADVHNMEKVNAPIYKSLYYVISYVALPLVLIILAVSFRLVPLRGIVSIMYMPFTLVYMGAGLLNFSYVRISSLFMYLPAIILTAGVFVLAFTISVMKAKRRQGEIQNEIRMFS